MVLKLSQLGILDSSAVLHGSQLFKTEERPWKIHGLEPQILFGESTETYLKTTIQLRNLRDYILLQWLMDHKPFKQLLDTNFKFLFIISVVTPLQLNLGIKHYFLRKTTTGLKCTNISSSWLGLCHYPPQIMYILT